MKKTFTKMQGLANDFIIFDYRGENCDLTPPIIQQLADRNKGVGCDQILVIETPKNKAHAFHYRIFNADGSEVGQCGNGARCVARYAYDQQLVQQRQFKVSTISGEMTLMVQHDHQVTVNMGTPIFDPKAIPLSNNFQHTAITLNIDSQPLNLQTVSMGNPHAILFVPNITTAAVATLGPIISNHAAFPQRCNVSFAEIVNEHTIKLRVYERGAAETQACGSGACATMVAAQRTHQVTTQVEVILAGGKLDIQWQGQSDAPVLMTGPADYVFEGKLLMAAL